MSIDFTGWPSSVIQAAIELQKKYDYKEIITKGANGYVIRGCNRLLNREVVIKFYYWGDGVHAEPHTLSSLASNNVLRVDDAAAVDSEYAYFITPYCTFGDLEAVIQNGKVGVIEAIDLIQGISSGVSFIHGCGHIHRDLKPSNIFCTDPQNLVIGDFGSVVKIGSDGYAQTGSTHSLIYRTPEEISTGRAYPEGDIYQLGIILYQLFGGQLSYNLLDWLTTTEKSAYESLDYPDNQIYADGIVKGLILKGRLLNLRSLPAWCPKKLVALIRTCTHVDLSKRFESVSALKARLSTLRSAVPDWRIDTHPVLHRSKYKVRAVRSDGGVHLKKMVNAGTSWRKVHTIKPKSLSEAIAEAEKL